MLQHGLDWSIAGQLRGMVLKPPILPDEVQQPEEAAKLKSFVEGFEFDDDMPADLQGLLWEALKDPDEGLLEMFKSHTGAESPTPNGEPERPLDLTEGFPQGANFSPFLSILQLIVEGSPTFAALLMYADDGLFYSMRKFTEEQVKAFFTAIGMEIAPEKSG